MDQYKLHPRVLSVGMKGNRILKDKKQVVDGSNFNDPEELVKQGFLVKYNSSESESEPDLETLKAKYLELSGEEKVNGRWGINKLQEEIEKLS